MAGLSGILLIVALVLISGVIAYVGDIVGRRMGRKRLSLFGLRPRHTAIVISIAAGMLITIMTLAVAMRVSQDVKDGFLHVGEMRQRQRELAEELAALNRSMSELQRTREAAEVELQERKKELEEAKRILEEVSADLDATEEELANASSALKRAEGAVRRVSTRWLELAREKDELQRDIENLRAQAAGGITLERSTPIIFGAGQPLDWQLIDGGQSVSSIRKELDQFVADLDAQAQGAGAVPVSDSDDAVVIRKPVREPEADSVVWFSDDQVLDAIAERVHESAGGVIVRAFSVFNTHSGEPVRVDFELFRNHLVFRRGEVLAQALIDGRQPEPALMASLLGLLREEVNPRARAHNIMPRPNPSSPEAFGSSQETVGDISIEELFAVVQRLQAIEGMARVTAVAAADTWTIGPLEVDLLVTSAANLSPG
ncbi:MAG TPA: DUF3084 domain-containing protein [Armatimonadota bacterium]|nr:DUF3084 domain-containing protein [Armatimonadota bacterium]